MKTLLVVFTLALAAGAASAQQDSGNAPANPSAPPSPPPVPPMPSSSSAPPNLKMTPGAPAAAANTALRMIDEMIKDLSQGVATFDDCVAGLDYLRDDLATTKARLLEKGGGKIPSNQAGRIVTKTKLVGRQQLACTEQTKKLDEHFTMAVRSLAGIQPPNHAGIPPRRLKILKLREKFTAAVKRIGAKGAKATTEAQGPDAGNEDSDSQQ